MTPLFRNLANPSAANNHHPHLPRLPLLQIPKHLHPRQSLPTSFFTTIIFTLGFSLLQSSQSFSPPLSLFATIISSFGPEGEIFFFCYFFWELNLGLIDIRPIWTIFFFEFFCCKFLELNLGLNFSGSEQIELEGYDKKVEDAGSVEKRIVKLNFNPNKICWSLSLVYFATHRFICCDNLSETEVSLWNYLVIQNFLKNCCNLRDRVL